MHPQHDIDKARKIIEDAFPDVKPTPGLILLAANGLKMDSLLRRLSELDTRMMQSTGTVEKKLQEGLQNIADQLEGLE